MTANLQVLFETLGVAITFGAIAVGWSSFEHSERAQSPVWGGFSPAPNWDLSAEIGAQAERTRATATARSLYAIAASLSAAAIAIGVASAHGDNRPVLIVATAIAVCFLAGALTLRIRHGFAMRLSRAREVFERFYVGTGFCKYEKFEPALERFALENPTAHRIAQRSLIADQKTAAAEHERQMEAYVKAMGNALA